MDTHWLFMKIIYVTKTLLYVCISPLQTGQLSRRVITELLKQLKHITKCLQGKQIILQISSKHILQSNISLLLFHNSILVICAEAASSLALTIFSRSIISAAYLHKVDCHLVHIADLWLIPSSSPVSSESILRFWNLTSTDSYSILWFGLTIFSAEVWFSCLITCFIHSWDARSSWNKIEVNILDIFMEFFIFCWSN